MSDHRNTDADRPARAPRPSVDEWAAPPGASPQTPTAAHSRRSVLRAAVGVATGGVALSGRVDGPAGAGATQATPGTPAPGGLVPGVDYFPSPAEGVPDAYLKPRPPFRSVDGVPGRGGGVSTFQRTGNPPPAPRDQNQYWRELERRLGVEPLDADMVPAANYLQRLATTTAGGDLPDLTWVDLEAAPEQAEIIEQGAWTDLTPYLTGDALGEYPNLALYPERVWRNAMIDGRLWGVPRRLENYPPVLFLRQDWADTVGISRPRNAEEFFQLLLAFAEGDPDGNGQVDSYGLTSGNTNPFALDYFQQLFRVPHNWRLEADGTLTKDLETDEFRQTIDFMRRLFAAGVYHPDAAAMNQGQARDAFVAGQVGAFPGVVTGLPLPFRGLRDQLRRAEPPGEAVGLAPFGHDGGAAVAYNTPGFASYVMIPASVGEDEERVRELLRILDYYAAPGDSEERTFLTYGLEGVHHTVQPDGSRVLNDRGELEIKDLNNLNFGEPSGFYYPHLPSEAVYMQQLVAELVAIGIDDPTFGLSSPTLADQGNQLDQLRIDRVIAIVAGREPLEALDQFVADWRGRGGDDIRGEYEEGLAAR